MRLCMGNRRGHCNLLRGCRNRCDLSRRKLPLKFGSTLSSLGQLLVHLVLVLSLQSLGVLPVRVAECVTELRHLLGVLPHKNELWPACKSNKSEDI